MRFTRLSNIGFLAILIFATSSCEQPACETDLPAIQFERFINYIDPTTGKLLDSAKVTISFDDCNGDIGLSEADTVLPYHIEGEYYYNLLLDYFEWQNGKWVQFDSLDIPFHARVPKLVVGGRQQALEGEIDVTIEPLYFLLTNYDTLKYQITLIDRALNRSNTVETPAILKP